MKKTLASLSVILLVLVFAVPILGITDGESRIIQAIRECCVTSGALPIGAASAALQTSGAQKTQVVDSGAEAATVTGGRLDVNSLFAAGELHLGEVSGRSAIVTGTTLTLPSGASTYASGDLMANSATAGSVVPITLAVSRAADLTGMIRRVRLKKSTTTGAGTVASFRVHFYAASPTVTNGDNGVWLSTESSYLGACDVSTDRVFSDGAKGIGAPNTGGEINFLPATGTVNIFALLEARAAYVPGASEAFTLVAEVFQN